MAGSCTLLLQTVLPALVTADGPSTVVLEGGTHNPMAPPFDFLKASFLPILAKMGMAVTTELVRPGFYPAGGGRIAVSVKPTGTLSPLELSTRCHSHISARAVCAQLPLHIAEQLLIPMALAGSGCFLTGRPIDHTITNIETIQQFLEITFQINRLGEEVWEVRL